MASIVPDAEVFMQFTEKSKQQYSRIWAHFRDFVAEVDFETDPPVPVIIDPVFAKTKRLVFY